MFKLLYDYLRNLTILLQCLTTNRILLFEKHIWKGNERQNLHMQNHFSLPITVRQLKYASLN